MRQKLEQFSSKAKKSYQDFQQYIKDPNVSKKQVALDCAKNTVKGIAWVVKSAAKLAFTGVKTFVTVIGSALFSSGNKKYDSFGGVSHIEQTKAVSGEVSRQNAALKAHHEEEIQKKLALAAAKAAAKAEQQEAKKSRTL